MEQINTDTLNQQTALLSPSKVVIVFTICFSFWLFDFWRPENVYYNESVFNHHEVLQHYSYLPAFVFNKGVFHWEKYKYSFGANADIQQHAPNVNYGVALLQLPFFTAASFWPCYYCKDEAGFSLVYANSIRYAGLFYVILGLIALRKFLLFYFSDNTTAFTLFLTVFGNMFFYYAFVRTEWPQSYQFFLFSVFLYMIHKWHQQSSYINSVLTGVIFGLITLVHFFDSYVFLFFLIWKLKPETTVKQKVYFLWENRLKLLVIAVASILMWLPQYIFNYSKTGTILLETVGTVSYDFFNGQFGNVFASYKCGWFIYSPIILFVFLGIFFLPKSAPFNKWVFLACFLLIVYVYASSPQWYYTKTIGAQHLSPFMAVLSFPLAVWITKIFAGKSQILLGSFLRIGFVVIGFLCFSYTLSIAHMVSSKKVDGEGMNWETHNKIIRRFKLPEKN